MRSIDEYTRVRMALHAGRVWATAMIAGIGAALAACSEGPTDCAITDKVNGVCAGVPPDPVCGSDTCTEGVDCTSVVEADTSAALASALEGAASGTCIALKPGTYGNVILPQGVRLLGKSADDVVIGSLDLADETFVRGLTVTGQGVTVAPGASVALESVLVQGSSQSGIVVGDGATLHLVASEVEAAALYGIYAGPTGTLQLEQTIVESGGGPGIWVSCQQACCDGMTDRPNVILQDVLVRENRIIGVALYGVSALMDNVDILETKPGDLFNFGEGGGGLSVAGCSNLDGTGVRMNDNSLYGGLVDNADVALGIASAGGEVEASRNLMGIWVQNVPSMRQVHIENSTIADNDGVGLGADGGGAQDADQGSIIFCLSSITGTKNKTLPVKKNGQIGFKKEVGDGVTWLGRAKIFLEEVDVTGNERAGIVINGVVPADSKVKNVTSSDNGDGSPEMQALQQSLADGDPELVPESSTTIETDANELLEIPIAPAAFGQDL